MFERGAPTMGRTLGVRRLNREIIDNFPERMLSLIYIRDITTHPFQEFSLEVLHMVLSGAFA
jgi:hypothetical protein